MNFEIKNTNLSSGSRMVTLELIPTLAIKVIGRPNHNFKREIKYTEEFLAVFFCYPRFSIVITEWLFDTRFLFTAFDVAMNVAIFSKCPCK